MLRSVVSGAVLLLFTLGITAQEPKKFQSKDGNFAATFPGMPTSSKNKSGMVELNVTAVEKGGAAYMVIFTDLPKDSAKLAKATDILEGGEKGLVDNFKAKVTQSKSVEFGPQKFPAREILADVKGDKADLQLRLTMILVEGRLYQVLLLGPKAVVSGKDGDAFFASFEITK